MKPLQQDLKQLAYLLAVPGLKLIYLLVNRLPQSAVNVLTWLDAYIPVIPAFVVPYMLFYPYVFGGLVYLLRNNREAYLRTVLSYSMGLMVCYTIYLVFPTTVPRLPLTGSDVFSGLLGFIYSIDRPYNCLPSIHVLGTALTMFGVAMVEGVRKNWFNALGVMIILSTMFTRQHGILDVVAAILLSGVVFVTAPRLIASAPYSHGEKALMPPQG